MSGLKIIFIGTKFTPIMRHVELEWDVDIDNDKAADEDGQMKIF